MFGNPVLRKELLLRMRFRQGKAAQIAALLGIVFLVGIFHYYVLAWMLNDRNGFTGRGVWYIVIGLQYILICMIAPVVTANAITQEKEQQTWEMLVFTRLLPKQIIVGKLIARLMPIALIILLGMPLAVICALYSRQIGGQSAELVSLGHFFAVYFLMAATGFFLATFGLFASWLLKRTLYAIMASYTFAVGVLVLGTTLVTGMISTLVGDNGNFFLKCPLMWFNPAVLMTWASGTPNSSEQLSMFVGIAGYIGLSLLMIWRMIAGFRRFAYQ